MKYLILQPFKIVITVLGATPKKLKLLYASLLLLSVPEFLVTSTFLILLQPFTGGNPGGLGNQDTYLDVLLLSQLVQLSIIILLQPILQGMKIVLVARADSTQAVDMAVALKIVRQHCGALLGVGLLQGLFEIPSRALFLGLIVYPETLFSFLGALLPDWLAAIYPTFVTPMSLVSVFRIIAVLEALLRVWLFVIPYQIVLSQKSLSLSIRASFEIFRRHWLLMLIAIQLYSALIVTLPLFVAKSLSLLTASTVALFMQPVVRLLIAPVKQIADVLFYKSINQDQLSPVQDLS
ncbi:MAG: hypothetical protein AAF572_09215 [Cyanobacteria bacterium P01_B01_bin.77]